MIPAAEARALILAGIAPLPAEVVGLDAGLGRVLAEDLTARRTQPTDAVSAMDGWAVRTADLASLPATLRRIGEAPAGHPFPGAVGPGEAVRIFTGAPLPAGADTVVLQEDCDAAGTDADGVTVMVREGTGPGRWVRPAGLDFREGDVGLTAGTRLEARHIALAAAMNRPWLSVRRRPRVAILSTGDEVVLPGEPLGPGRIVSANGPGLAAFVTRHGGVPVSLGIAPDRPDALARLADMAAGCDLILTTGGASVGEHDLVRSALEPAGLELAFWKIAMRPGKPLLFGRLKGIPMLGLPGNPVSSLVCALLFAGPLLEALHGRPAGGPARTRALLGAPLAANDRREDYLRATLARDADGHLVATPFPVQDSSMLSLLARADALVVRPPHAPAARPGDAVDVLTLDGL